MWKIMLLMVGAVVARDINDDVHYIITGQKNKQIKSNEEDDLKIDGFKYHDRKMIIKFSPQEDCTGTIIHFINHTDKKIKVMAYALTCPRILNALCRAAARGVKIRVLVDKSYASKPYIQKLKSQPNANVFVDAAPRIAHNKIMLFYNKSPKPFQCAVLTGSFNFSVSAQKFNSENIMILVDSQHVYDRYIQNWRYRKHLGDTHLLDENSTEVIQPKIHYLPNIKKTSHNKVHYLPMKRNIKSKKRR